MCGTYIEFTVSKSAYVIRIFSLLLNNLSEKHGRSLGDSPSRLSMIIGPPLSRLQCFSQLFAQYLLIADNTRRVIDVCRSDNRVIYIRSPSLSLLASTILHHKKKKKEFQECRYNRTRARYRRQSKDDLSELKCRFRRFNLIVCTFPFFSSTRYIFLLAAVPLD